MTSNEIREKYIKFFEKRGHTRIAPSPLVLEDDSTTLFTSAGMQQLVPYLKGEKKHPKGKRLVDSQPSVRAHGKNDDVLEVGDNRHLTVFEMLGNWSLGDYFKKEELPWFFEFLTKVLNLPKERLWVTLFKGDERVPKDSESYEIWKNLGVPKERIVYYGVKKNWWSIAGAPDEMPVGEIGGPTSEVFYDFSEGSKIHENSQFKNEKCHPNCECGRFLEIGNSVFMQYKKKKDGTLEELSQKNVDFGGGLERIAAAVKDDPDIFKTDLFWPLIQVIEKYSKEKYGDSKKQTAFRVISDHLKAATFLIVNEIVPSNKEHGYVLRKLLRRASAKMYLLKGEFVSIKAFKDIVKEIIAIYEGEYMNQSKDLNRVQEVIEEELLKFEKTLKNGLKIAEKTSEIDEKTAFNLYQTYGFPVEITIDVVQQRGGVLNIEKFREEFEKHRELSRSAGAKK